MREFKLGYGKSDIHFKLPEDKILDVIEGKQCAHITDIVFAVKEALSNPIGTKPLKEIVKKGDKVTVVVSDITRAWVRHDQFLPIILNELNEGGVPDSNITLIVAVGAHRLHTDEDNVTVYGKEVVKRVKIICNDVSQEENYVCIGTTTRGVDVKIHKVVAEADKVILTGGIVYHSMAGFGGGRKSIMPGVSSYATIQGNHKYCLHDEIGKGLSPYIGCGKLVGNPMDEDMVEMAAMVNPAFLFNVVGTAEGEFARFVGGHWYKAWEEGCKTVANIFGVPIREKADLVIATAGGYPKDINLYQGLKTADNAILACKEDGVIILLLECPEITEPPDFSAWYNYESLMDREIALRKGFTVPGFCALKNGLLAKRVPHIVLTMPENKEFITKAGMFAVTSMEEALALAEEKLGRKDYKITVMIHGANTVPMLV